ncbi:hypothetical protein [Microbacterium sp.]|uniref:hypothetical protein n=1 Tax=Microbacterium sp. TaxID=51671 RepID=UPI003A8FEA50
MRNSTSSVLAWIKSTCGDDSYREIARRANLSDSIISRQIRDLGALSFEVASAIARAYDSPVLAALLANALLTPEEAGASGIEASLRAATEQQLVIEIARRLDIPGAHDLFDKPIDDALQDARVTHINTRRNVPAADQDEREAAFESPIDHDADTDDLYD